MQQHLADPKAHPHVGISGAPALFAYGQRVRIALLEEKHGASVVARVVDTGDAFRGATKRYRVLGSEPLDVAMDLGQGWGVVQSFFTVVPGDLLDPRTSKPITAAK